MALNVLLRGMKLLLPVILGDRMPPCNTPSHGMLGHISSLVNRLQYTHMVLSFKPALKHTPMSLRDPNNEREILAKNHQERHASIA